LVKLHHLRVAPSIQPIAVERQAQFTIGGHIYSTWLDLLDKVKGGTRVRDLKTTAKAADGSNYLFQMIASAVAFRQDSGTTEVDTQLDMLVRTQRPKYHVVRWGPLTNSAIGVFGRQVDHANQIIKSGLFMANGIQNHACGSCGYQERCPAYQAAVKSRVINP
jgi:hypothetical protein